MATFTIHQGQTPVVKWDCDTGQQTELSPAHGKNGRAVLDETDFVSFTLDHPAPGVRYAIQIGEMWISEFLPEGMHPGGLKLDNRIWWAEYSYFESARGLTPVRICTQGEGAGHSELAAEGSVFVLPSKIGEDCYNAMSDDLARISKSLLSDLHGKSRRSYELKQSRALGQLHSKEEELQAIRKLCPRLERLIAALSRHPASKMRRTERIVRFTGQRRVSPRTLYRISENHPETGRTMKGVNVRETIREESFDIPEHQFLKAFLLFLRDRAAGCSAAAERHIAAIEKDRPFRDASPPGRMGKPTLYQTQDLPMIARLQAGMKRAEEVQASIHQMLSSALLRDTRGDFVPVRGGAFGRSSEYRELEVLMLEYLRHHARWVEGDSFNNIGKLTSTLYEQWCFLRIVEAFREAGVSLDEWNGSIGDLSKGRFTIDFSRGLRFGGDITPTLHLRISYQPWVHNLETAQRLLSPLYRGGKDAVSWSPDIVLEVCTRAGAGDAWVPRYAVVLDSKYSRRIREDQWEATGKYLEIRATHSRRQVCRQLWLVAPDPVRAGIQCIDPDVEFDDRGPSIEPDETVRFALGATPAPESSGEVFAEFAWGMIEFFKAHFSPT